MQKELCYQHIVINNDKPCPLGFEAALDTLGLLCSIIDIQGMSIHLCSGKAVMHKCLDQTTQDFDAHAITGKGTISQMLIGNNEQSDMKIIISGRVPMGLAGVTQTTFSSNFYAWHYAEDLPFCKDPELYPAHDMIWGKAAKKNSLQCLTTEPHGLCLYLEVKAGKIFFVVARPQGDIYDLSPFSKPEIFLHGSTCTGLNAERCSMEGIMLESGTRM